METDDAQRVIPFQLQFDKPVPFQIKLAEWNPEKDLLAMVTEDSKILLHRFNWQRLWTFTPGKCITSLCWRPDGKAIAVGLEGGTISLHNVENGKLLKSLKSHSVDVVCLNWEEEDEHLAGAGDHTLVYEDRTLRFFPPAPRAPRMTGVVSGDASFTDESGDSFQELLNSSHQPFNILCSVDKNGIICFSVFGIFPIGRINIHQIDCSISSVHDQSLFQLLDSSIYKVTLSKDLCRLIITCSGDFSDGKAEHGNRQMSLEHAMGFHCLVLDTSVFKRRENELHQLALQASNVGNLTEVIRTSLSVMHKQWSDAIHTFQEKFSSLSTLIVNHGLDSSPQEEFLSLLGGARTSPPVHQFLVNTLGESGLKRVMKSICSAGKELQLVALDHLQPATEIIGFRIGELRGLSRWHARYGGIGLDETLIDNAAERVGMFLVQVERFMKVLSSALQQFTNFFSWLLKCIKILMSEPSDQLLPHNSELVVVFLKFLYDQDPVGLLLELSAANYFVEVDSDTIQRVEELVKLGGYSDTDCLRRTLAKEFQHMESSFKKAFHMPVATISQKIVCQNVLPLFPFSSSPPSKIPNIPCSISFCKDAVEDESTSWTGHQNFADYVLFKISDGSFSDFTNCLGIVRGFVDQKSNVKKGYASMEGLILSIPERFECVDFSLYKDSQIVLILNETMANSDNNGSAHMMIVQARDLSFASIPSSCMNLWQLQELKDSIVHLQVEKEKVRGIPHNVVPPLAVSSSRGVACVFAARKRALVYILDEDEEDVSDTD